MKFLPAARQSLEPNLKSIVTHGLFFAGFASGIYGCWLIYHPVGFVAGGVLTVWFSLLIDKE